MSCAASGEGERDGYWGGGEGMLLLFGESAGAVRPAPGAMDGLAAGAAVAWEGISGSTMAPGEGVSGSTMAPGDRLAASPFVPREGIAARMPAPWWSGL